MPFTPYDNQEQFKDENQRFIDKYKQGMSSAQTQKIQQQSRQTGFIEKQFSAENKTPMQNISTGVAKGALSTIEGAAKLAGKGYDYISNKITGRDQKTNIDFIPDYATKSEGAFQGLGRGVEQIGEFFVPSTLFLKGAKVAEAGIEAAKLPSLVKGGAKLLSKAGIGAAETGAVTAVQSGGDKEEIKTAAKFGAGVPIVGSLIGKVSGALGGTSEALAKKIEQVSLRLTPAQKKALGKKLDDVTSFLTNNGITGTPEQRYQKVDEMYNGAEEVLSNFIKTHASTIEADTNSIIKQVQSIANKYKNDRDIISIEKQIDEFVKLLQSRFKGKIPLDALNELKRSTFKGAYNQAGNKVIAPIEHEIGGVLNKTIQNITNGLDVAGQDIKSFNKGYGTLIEAKKLLDIAKTRPELGLIGKLIATSVGGSIGTALGGPIGTAAGILAGQQGGKLLAGTAMRSQVVSALNKLSKLGKISEESAGTIKNFIFGGGNKKINLSPKEQKIADKITGYINKPKVGMSIEDVSKNNPLIQEARKYKSAEEYIASKQPKKVQLKSSVVDTLGGHEAPTADGNAPIWDLTGKYTDNKIYPNDIYNSDAPRMYSAGETYDPQAISIMQSLKDRPNARLDVYRAVPKDVKVTTLKPGEWVSITRDYAKAHGEDNLGGNYKIIKQNVSARDIFTDGNSIHEFGYDPQPAVIRENAPFDFIKRSMESRTPNKNTGYIKRLTEEYNQAHKSQPLQEGVKKSESVGLMRDAIRSDTKQYIKFLEKKLGDGKLSVEKYTQLDKRMETLKKVLKRIEAKKFTEEQYKKLQSYINKFKK